MKAITINQPWASLIAAGINSIDNKSWVVPKEVQGERVAIYAGTLDKYWHNSYPCSCSVRAELCTPCQFTRNWLSDGKDGLLPSEQILCTAHLVGQILPTEKGWTRKSPPKPTEIESFGALPILDALFWEPDCYGWILTEVEPLSRPLARSCSTTAFGIWGVYECNEVK